MKKALISVFDKEGLLPFAEGLSELGYGLVSTGGTASLLRQAGLAVEDVSDLTGFPECLGGRVKTLHPLVHAGILARRSEESDLEFLTEHGIAPIDLVVVNLYPFKQTILREDCTRELAIENIDIGGPTMLRAAAKNHESVTVVVDPEDYMIVLQELQHDASTSLFTRERLAAKVFRHTASYDALVASYMTKDTQRAWADKFDAALEAGDEAEAQSCLAQSAKENDQLTLGFEKAMDLRYGENPHQNAIFYKNALPEEDSLTEAVQLQGKELSYNNIADTDAALQMLKEFSKPTVVAVKHANPCGIASADTIEEAWRLAYEADSVSIFGGIVASNREISGTMADEMRHIFLEVVVAPSISEEAKIILGKKKNLRLLILPQAAKPFAEGHNSYKFVHGGLLVQNTDRTDFNMEDVHVVTEKNMEPGDFARIRFAMRCVKHVKSNGICLTQDFQTVGIGPGQPNRITAVQIACTNAGEKTKGAIMASDAFFPFDDCVRYAAENGVRLIVQPGGSVRDDESVAAANELGICMVFTGQRHFKH